MDSSATRHCVYQSLDLDAIWVVCCRQKISLFLLLSGVQYCCGCLTYKASAGFFVGILRVGLGLDSKFSGNYYQPLQSYKEINELCR